MTPTGLALAAVSVVAIVLAFQVDSAFLAAMGGPGFVGGLGLFFIGLCPEKHTRMAHQPLVFGYNFKPRK
jgi:hypothetical protein